MTDLLQRFIVQGKLYDELPSRIRASVTVSEYRQRVKETCIRRGLGWAESMASSSCGESDYYDSFMKLYRAEARAFPYQHAAYVCRHQRTTVFKYYTDILFAALRVEKPYHQLPNFTAADIVRVLGIGRNEYIDILNQCRAKRVLWRVNRGLVRDLLPSEPRYFPLEPWWLVCVVNLTVSEFKQLSPEELAALEVAAVPEGVPVSQLDESMLRSLYKRGLVYLDVPVVPEDSFKIPPLEGFVSNKDTQDDSKADPMETLLYSVFVANSERATVQEVAKILDCDLKSVRHALSLACRLGFAHRATPAPAASPPAAGGLLGFPPASTSPGQKPAAPSLLDQLEPALHGPGAGLTHDQLPGGSQPLSMLAADRDMSLPPLDGSWAEGEQAQRQGELPGAEEAAEEAAGNSQVVAVILDTEATGYLMMGALSPGLKKHSVTLFEAGRVAGDAVITELIDELWASFHAGASFEGEMRSLTDYAASLASMLEFVRDSRGPSAASSIELLRRESLGGLSASAARRVLAHTYCAVVPILLRPPALPLAPNQARPVSFGPTTEAASPWLQLLVAELAGAGAPALVLPAGLCLRELPPQLQHCTAALLSCWDGQGPFFRSADARASDGAGVPAAPVPNLVHSLGLLWELNTLLQRTAVLVQPLQCEVDYAVPGSARLRVVDVPLPLPQPAAGADARDHRLEALDALSGERCLICPPARLRQALQESGLECSIGCVRLMSRNDCVTSQGSGSGASVERGSSAPCGSQPEAEDEFVPFDVKLGVPLQYLALCQMVCSSARQAQVLSPEGLERQLQGQLKLQRGILDIMARLWPGSNARSEEWEEPSGTTGLIAPSRPLLFDGSTLQSVDLADSLAQSVQGFASLY